MLHRLLNEKEQYLRATPGSGGVPVPFKSTQSLQLSVSLAALQLLRALHKEGWVHGDSHLGNFVYCDGNVYAIDFERSFPSSDAIQHLLDIQELFGHISGILLDAQLHHQWDMLDIYGLVFHRFTLCLYMTFALATLMACITCMHNRHPLFAPRNPRARHQGTQRRITLYMLPVCTCFTSPRQSIRIKGCSICTASDFNRKSATYFAENGDKVLSDMEAWGLSKLRSSLQQTRYECTQKCHFVANVIFPCLQDGLTLLENSADILKLPVKNLVQSKVSCGNVLKKLLYMPPLSERCMALSKLMWQKLHNSGHEEAARVFWLYVASR